MQGMVQDWREYADRLLCEMHDLGGGDDVFSMFNTILTTWRRKTGKHIDPANDLAELGNSCEAVKQLFQAGHIQLFMEGPGAGRRATVPDADAAQWLKDLPSWFKYDETSHFWASARGGWREVAWPAFDFTEEGYRAAEKVLDERGWRWWDLELPDD
jgi:hypothetical protein